MLLYVEVGWGAVRVSAGATTGSLRQLSREVFGVPAGINHVNVTGLDEDVVVLACEACQSACQSAKDISRAKVPGSK